MNNYDVNADKNDPLELMNDFANDQPSQTELYPEFDDMNVTELNNEDINSEQNY